MRRALPVLIALALAGASCSYSAEAPGDSRASAASSDPGGWRLATPFPIKPFTAVDLEGRDVSTSTWKGRVVIVNVWATWCGPCRREMPALAALQDKYRDHLLVLGLLQDNVTDGFAREFGKAIKLNYPIVRSTTDIEIRFPTVLALPMTFLIDADVSLVSMFGGEVGPGVLEAELQHFLKVK